MLVTGGLMKHQEIQKLGELAVDKLVIDEKEGLEGEEGEIEKMQSMELVEESRSSD